MSERPTPNPVLTIRDLRTHFFMDEGVVRAVDGLDLDVPRGDTIGLVGESGCGKSVTAFAVLRLITPPGRIVSGRIALHQNGTERVLTDLDENGQEIRRIRGKEVAMVFQEPMSSLSPVHMVGHQIVEAIALHTDRRGRDARHHAIDMLARVGLPDAPTRFRQYPHEMSGGMRQRVMIAMALSCRPALLIADEPTTALDVTIQAQILDLMRELQDELGMAILLITHDLGVVAEMAHHVAVMYLGRIVEQSDVERVFANPLHPYTRALLQSIPGVDKQRKSQLLTISGSVPDPFERPTGCPFHPRCPEAVKGRCDQGEPPPLVEVAAARKVACWLRHEGGES
jgi:peptide/nickel transport system ATP-binding protein